jgi:diacylglycerol O-acyltransferase
MTKPIAPLDLAWFLTESTSGPKHVGVVLVFEAPPARAGIPGDVVAAYRARPPRPPFIYVPRLVAAGGPEFVAADDYDPHYHVRHLALPRGATYESFLALVADLHEPMLDRDRPLFRMWVIEGIPGNRFAVYLKAHHAIVDGASGAQRIFASLRAKPGARIPPPAFAIEGATRKAQLPRSLVGKLASLPALTAKQTLAVKDVYVGAARQVVAALLGTTRVGSVPFQAKRTPLNAPLTMARSFATMSLPLAEMRAVGKAFSATLNDVAATIVDDGIHRYLRQHGDDCDRLVGMCPISLREEGDTEARTKASAMFLRLGAPEASVVERIGEVVASTAGGKAELKAMSKDAAMLYAIAALGLAELFDATRLKRVTRPLANFVLSNVPGTAEPMFLGGARMTGCFPISGLGMGVGLNVTLTSYAGSMDFGFVGNGRTLRDLPALAGHVRDAYEALKAAAHAPAGAKRARKRDAARAPARARPAPRRAARRDAGTGAEGPWSG